MEPPRSGLVLQLNIQTQPYNNVPANSSKLCIRGITFPQELKGLRAHTHKPAVFKAPSRLIRSIIFSHSSAGLLLKVQMVTLNIKTQM